jgi:phosphate transport system protein
MINHILSCYDKDLAKIRASIVHMGSFVERIIQLATDSFHSQDAELGQKAKVLDLEVNKLDDDIEALAIEVIALKSPKANDLRETIAALKIAVILERMGDLAKNIARKVELIEYNFTADLLSNIVNMGSAVKYMQQLVLNAYKEKNIAMLDEILLEEERVDAIYLKLRLDIESIIRMYPDDTSALLTVLFALKNFERIADYITKIAYISKYVVTGESPIDEE